MVKMSSTSIPCKGDRKFAMILKALAAKRNTSVAELTRRAIDKMYGDELREVDSFFVADTGAYKLQNERKSSE